MNTKYFSRNVALLLHIFVSFASFPFRVVLRHRKQQKYLLLQRPSKHFLIYFMIFFFLLFAKLHSLFSARWCLLARTYSGSRSSITFWRTVRRSHRINFSSRRFVGRDEKLKILHVSCFLLLGIRFKFIAIERLTICAKKKMS